MKIAITGSTGMVGSALVEALRLRGDTVIRLVRGEPKGSDQVRWDPAGGLSDPQALAGCDAVVHLAGENIAARRWSDAQKERIRTSRVEGTRSLVQSLLSLEGGPRTFISASAIGFYGATGEARVDETSAPGTGFLPEVCQAWEDAAAPLKEAGMRVVHLRFGVILSPEGGALKKMLTPFKLGLGGNVGSGSQGMSWVSLRDAVGAAVYALDEPALQGPANVCAPGAVSNADFTKALGRALGRPTIFPMPAFAARLAFGELADDLLLASAWVQPNALTQAGYAFQDAEIDGALSFLLKRSAA